MRKIWSFDLYGNNKVTSHNIFAIPVITPTFSIIIWTKELITSTGSFHVNSDIDRTYSYRNKDARDFNSFVDIYISRLVSINSLLMEELPTKTYLAPIFNREKESLVRVASQFVQCVNVQTKPNEPPKKT